VLGLGVGCGDGLKLGKLSGSGVGRTTVGLKVDTLGAIDGSDDGLIDGSLLGSNEGNGVGSTDGPFVGYPVGSTDGSKLGNSVGNALGSEDGEGVGITFSSQTASTKSSMMPSKDSLSALCSENSRCP